jgi:hypothetical protein
MVVKGMMEVGEEVEVVVVVLPEKPLFLPTTHLSNHFHFSAIVPPVHSHYSNLTNWCGFHIMECTESAGVSLRCLVKIPAKYLQLYAIVMIQSQFNMQ